MRCLLGYTAMRRSRALRLDAFVRERNIPSSSSVTSGRNRYIPIWLPVPYLLFGASGWAIRLVAAMAGLATIPFLYLLARELFPPEEGQPSLVGLLAAFWLATSYWHIIYSRFGIEPVLLPLLITLASYFLWRGVKSQHQGPFIWSGLSLGTSLYSYQAARLSPFVILSFLGGLFLIDRHFRQIHLTNAVLLLTVSFLVLVPLGLFALAHPDLCFARARGVSISNPKYGQVLQTLPTSVVKTIAMFTFGGDPILAHNPASRRILEPLTAICFLVGFLVSPRRWKSPSYLFVLLWFAIMLLPAILTGVDLPHFSRAIGILPVVCIFHALGVEATWLWLKGRGCHGLLITFSSLG